MSVFTHDPRVVNHFVRSHRAVYGATMKHITMADKSLLIGDEAADLLLSYAALVAQTDSGDTVDLRAIGVDGVEVTAGFLLNSGTVLMIESSTGSVLPEPNNQDAVDYMRGRIDSYATIGTDSSPFDTAEAE